MGADINELLSRPSITVVGSRKVSSYGNAVTTSLVTDLARAGVAIVSGLALGVDAVAHRAALAANGRTIAVLPCGLDQIYPASHRSLAQQILGQGGALVSEYPAGSPVYKHNFIARNRIACGLTDALLITEAAAKSGTLHTAQFALEQGKDVMAVPGNITSPTSVGTNNLIKSGAIPVTDMQDVLLVLGLNPMAQNREVPHSDNPHEQTLLNLLSSGINDGAELLQGSQLEVTVFNQVLTMLEIRGQIRPLGNNRWGLTN